ncbi:NEW3 domain-containing protein [Thermomonas sp.]
MNRSPIQTSSVYLLALALAPFTLLNAAPAQAANVESDCAAINASYVPVTGKVATTTPNMPRPAKGAAFRDPAFKSCVIRATDHVADGIGSTFVRNDYSRRQAFNADSSLFIAYAYNGSWLLYDANTLARIKTLSGPGGDAEPQWDPLDPKSLYYVPTNGGTTLQKLNVDTNTSSIAANFAGKLPWTDATRVWTKSEGSPSADGRYWCFMAETDAFNIRGVFTYDLKTQTVVGTRAMSNRPDHVSMSASGRSCVVSDGDVSGGIVAWDRTFSTSRKLHTIGEHSDLAIGANGDDYFVFADYAGSGDLVMVDVDTGVRTSLLPTYIDGTATAYHVSGKAFNKPGWILLSTYANYGGPEKWLHQRVMAVELKANPTIINLAHHHGQYNAYWTEPHATVNRDFTKVLFNSNWGTTSDLDVDAYMVRLPDGLLSAGSTPTPPTDPTPPTTPPVAACTRVAPTVSLTGPTTTQNAGSAVSYTVNVRNNDTATCAATAFSVARSVPAGWTGTLGSTSLTLSPGIASTTSLTVTSPTTATGGSYGLGAGVSSAAGSGHTANASASMLIATALTPPPTCTRRAPTITMTGGSTSPVAPGTQVGYTVKVLNNDSAVCTTTAFRVARAVPYGWTGTLGSTSMSIAPGASASTSLNVISTTSATPDAYPIASGISSATGSTHTASASTSYTVAQPVTTPPPATIGQTETVSTDKASYVRGETVRMESQVMLNGKPAVGATVYFTVFKAGGGSIVTQAKTDSSGYARSPLALASTATTGSYGLYVSATTANASSSASSSFLVK